MININDYEDFENISVAQFKVAIEITCEKILEAMKNKKTKETLQLFKDYCKLNNLLNKRLTMLRKNRYNTDEYEKKK